MSGDTSTIDVDLQNAASTDAIPSHQDIITWVTLACEQQKPIAEVSIRIVDIDESRALNKQFRNKDKPTNVLSFPAEFPEGVDIPFIGDLVICAPIVISEAQQQQKPPEAHWAHMVIHGTLHLLGYDHIDDQEAEKMETLETSLLKKLNHPCPYT